MHKLNIKVLNKPSYSHFIFTILSYHYFLFFIFIINVLKNHHYTLESLTSNLINLCCIIHLILGNLLQYKVWKLK
jgi:hypothetical protein